MSYSPVKIAGKFGYGTMSHTWTPKPTATGDAVAAIQHVINKHDVTFINWGEFYGPDGANLKLLKAFLEQNDPAQNRKLVFSIKGGTNLTTFTPDGSKQGIQRSIDNILSYFPEDKNRRPQILFEAARRDLAVPYGETTSYIAEYVKAGKIDGISLSEVGSESITKAANTFPISAVELEFSILCQDLAHNGVLAELSKRKIPIIAYSPLHRGLLTDHAAENADTFLSGLAEGDMRLRFDRFSPENFANNIKSVKKLYEFAHNKKNTSLESLALSWIVKVSGSAEFEGIKNVTHILPIPSGTTKDKIDRNFSNLIDLTDEDLSEIQKITKEHPVKGYRYNEAHESLLFA